eukprot:373201-Lingulodinium_polyedra.AAC.1
MEGNFMLHMAARHKPRNMDWSKFTASTITETRRKFVEMGFQLIEDRVLSKIWARAGGVHKTPGNRRAAQIPIEMLRHCGNDWRRQRDA